MTIFSFGQPDGGIVQVAYVVADIPSSALRYTELLGVRPWFVRGPFSPVLARYRGKPTDISISLARGFTGHLMVELVQQHNDAPSVYREMTERYGYGFHHWAAGVTDFDASLTRYEQQGCQVAFSDMLPSGARIVYLDTLGELPGMIELIEMTEAQDQHYFLMYKASADWDGTEFLRSEPAANDDAKGASHG